MVANEHQVELHSRYSRPWDIQCCSTIRCLSVSSRQEAELVAVPSAANNMQKYQGPHCTRNKLADCSSQVTVAVLCYRSLIVSKFPAEHQS